MNCQECAPDLLPRLMEHRRIDGDCWVWTGNRGHWGYGRMSFRGVLHRVHRLAAHLWHGLDLSDTQAKALHSCDNPPCFNPEHLWIGTQTDNHADMVAKGRASGPSKWPRCSLGHELSAGNRVKATDGRGRCRICWNERQKEYRLRKKPVRAIAEALK